MIKLYYYMSTYLRRKRKKMFFFCFCHCPNIPGTGDNLRDNSICLELGYIDSSIYSSNIYKKIFIVLCGSNTKRDCSRL